VDVLDHDDRGAIGGQAGEERAPGLVGLEAHLPRREVRKPEARILETEREREHGCRPRRIGHRCEHVVGESRDLRERRSGRIRVQDTRVGLEDLGERPVRDGLAVREAPTLEHRR
jgi:hypothetical protein